MKLQSFTFKNPVPLVSGYMHAAFVGKDGVTAIAFEAGAVFIAKNGKPWIVASEFGVGHAMATDEKPKRVEKES